MKKFTFKTIILLIGIIVSQYAISQDYKIYFAILDADEKPDSVQVFNLDQMTDLTLAGSDVLHLVKGVGIVNAQTFQPDLSIYPNPMQQTTNIQFMNPLAGNVMISVFDVLGRELVNQSNYLSVGESTFKLSGLSMGAFVVNISSSNYKSSAIVLSKVETSQVPTIELLQNIGHEISHKSAAIVENNIVEMQYNEGEGLKFTAYFKSIESEEELVPNSSQTIEFTYPAIAEFTSDMQFVDTTCEVQFYDNSLLTPTAWHWDFGDGNTSTEQNPTHIYSSIGTFSVSLKVSNSHGENTKIESDYIQVTALPYADAGNDTLITDDNILIELSANSPIPYFGNGKWTILSGDGGSFENDTIHNTIFIGTHCTSYDLQWTISTSCNSFSDTVNIEFDNIPSIAEAGDDQIFTDGTISATLAANTPESGHGLGVWSILSGEGGSFVDSTLPNTVFNGVLHENYKLLWEITSNCGSNTDSVVISFAQDGAGEILTDIDGNNYNTVYIGTQLWMAENLRVSREYDGTDIPHVLTNTDWSNLGYVDSVKAYSYINNSTDNLETYGALYTVAAAMNACPEGWHLPSSEEWSILESYIANDGHDGSEGKALKTTTGWDNNGSGTDNYSFSAKPGGSRHNQYGTFGYEGMRGLWWGSSKESWSSLGCYTYTVRIIKYNYDNIRSDSEYPSMGLSVRCIKD